MSGAAPTARERLLAAADELFYAEGVHTVGIDRVIERAGVAKASLYNAFGSKDELIAAYLQRRAEAMQRRVTEAVERHDTPRERALAPFEVQEALTARAGYRGCAFANATAEDHSEGAESVTAAHRAWTRETFTRLAAEAGVADPEPLARQLQLLWDGSCTSARQDRDPSAARVARSAAEALLDVALRAT